MNQQQRKSELIDMMDQARSRTLALLELVPLELLKTRLHDFYSPVGWHFGHIGMTEEAWTLVNALGKQPTDAQLSHLYANIPDNPKEDRVQLPDKEEIIAYLAQTRAVSSRALVETDLLDTAPLVSGGYAWMFALQHEFQHQETILELLQLANRSMRINLEQRVDIAAVTPPENRLIQIPAGEFEMGYDGFESYDNEREPHSVSVSAFEMQEYPVTVGNWRDFMLDGGYENRRLWREEGWNWVQKEAVRAPYYWTAGIESESEYAANGVRILTNDLPVSSISWFEADAYATWAKLRLPTEVEWEYVARYDPKSGETRKYSWGNNSPEETSENFGSNSGPDTVGTNRSTANPFGLCGLNGGVWEWTSSPFLPYNGYKPYPYDGYSKDHMDGKHYVCKGGSWATAAYVLRSSFRNWYVPDYRQGFLGLRCAR